MLLGAGQLPTGEPRARTALDLRGGGNGRQPVRVATGGSAITGSMARSAQWTDDKCADSTQEDDPAVRAHVTQYTSIESSGAGRQRGTSPRLTSCVKEASGAGGVRDDLVKWHGSPFGFIAPRLVSSSGGRGRRSRLFQDWTTRDGDWPPDVAFFHAGSSWSKHPCALPPSCSCHTHIQSEDRYQSLPLC